MVEPNAVIGNQSKAHLSNPTTKRGSTTPMIMTEGNTHIIYCSADNLVFRGRNGNADFVYDQHRKPITALTHVAANSYCFGDEAGVCSWFTFTPECYFKIEKTRPMFNGQINAIRFFNDIKETTMKMVVIGDGGRGAQQAVTLKIQMGMECGQITGTSVPLLCADLTSAPKTSDKTNFYSGGESGELFMHVGAPFEGNGKVVERFAGDQVMAIKVCNETNRVYVATKNKKVCVYDAQTTEKLAEVADAHAKTIYGLAIAPTSAEASFVTCSADNLVKTWKFDAEAKTLTNLATIEQSQGAVQDLTRQLTNILCFEEAGAMQTIAVSVNGDLVMSSNSAPAGIISAQKEAFNAVTSSADGTVYYSTEIKVYALRQGVSTAVTGILGKSPFVTMASREQDVYIGSAKGTVHKINENAVTVTKELGDVTVLDFSLSASSVWVLASNKEIHELDPTSLEVKRSSTMPFEATCCTLVPGTAEIWVGDKKNKVHVLSADTLEQTQEIDVPNVAIALLETSSDSSMVVACDKSRRAYVYGASNKEQSHEHMLHKDYIDGVCFTDDNQGLVTVSQDHSLMVYNLLTKKNYAIARAHGDKTIAGVTIRADKTIFTVGQDLQVREWSPVMTWDKIPAA